MTRDETKARVSGLSTVEAGTGYALETTINEFGRLVWGFTLYCAGRRTYAPSICERVIRDNMGILLFPWRANIVSLVMGRFASTFCERVAAERERREAIAAGDPDAWRRGWKGGQLGETFDEDGWLRVATELAAHADVAPELVNANWDGEDAPVIARFVSVDDFWFMVASIIRHDLPQGSEAVFSAGELTDFVRRHAGELNGKWAANIVRDLTDDFYVSMLPDGDDNPWEGLLEVVATAGDDGLEEAHVEW